ncbi:unnamed protein product [Lepeophtheirus salmonis]|uniref:(salmon louse) hypothetical protein n=1 Tax=Lepeophtheirus salmonis TaxID=72036 RepID=A0A7R8CJK0_LEPSM|nr:uncharacterized protein LOC121129326 isoform X2 [Lepeophtheirus salmonis]CAB4058975.1 unnamed protein product [Lepeophtheirus salmonis]CAF2842241.1 unnamed protein product [Lepeophtheirus salmonis]
MDILKLVKREYAEETTDLTSSSFFELNPMNAIILGGLAAVLLIGIPILYFGYLFFFNRDDNKNSEFHPSQVLLQSYNNPFKRHSDFQTLLTQLNETYEKYGIEDNECRKLIACQTGKSNGKMYNQLSHDVFEIFDKIIPDSYNSEELDGSFDLIYNAFVRGKDTKSDPKYCVNSYGNNCSFKL